MWRGRLNGWAATTKYVTRRLLSDSLELLFPEPLRCAACGRSPVERSWIRMCERCLGRLAYVRSPICGTCGKPLRAGRTVSCADCARGDRLFGRVRAATLYDAEAREYVHRLKFRGERALAVPLGRLVARVTLEPEASASFRKCDAVLPVPIDPVRAEVRSFNQAELLAEQVAIAWGRPLWTDVLVRRSGTHAQVGLDRRARMANLRGALHVNGRERVKGRVLVVVDDVFTTGATMEECARVLLRAGALQVNGLCFSIGVTDSDWNAGPAR